MKSHPYTQIVLIYQVTQLKNSRCMCAVARGGLNTRDESQVWILMHAGLVLNLGCADLLQRELVKQ